MNAPLALQTVRQGLRRAQTPLDRSLVLATLGTLEMESLALVSVIVLEIDFPGDLE